MKNKNYDLISREIDFDISHTFDDSDLNGSKGIFRANSEQNIVGCNTDHEAIQAFLQEYVDSPSTQRLYTKECERLLIWAMLHLKKPLSSMNRDDFNAYIDFMRKPAPTWCGKKVNKSSDNWRPFTGPLSDAAVKTSVACINSLMSWLVNAGYLSGNPLGLIRNKRNKSSTESPYKKVERFLDDDMWTAVLMVVETMPIESHKERYQKERIRFMLTFFALLGARINELSKCIMPDFQSNVGGWFWQVVGKGNKYATVAMPKDMVDALMRWRKFLGLPALPKRNEKIAAIPSVNYHYEVQFDKPGLKPRRINEILKEFFEKAAFELSAGGQEDKAEKIRSASAHWLRHTSITQKINAGINQRLVQIDARHSDARTTGLYTHDEEKLRSKESQKHQISWNQK